MKRGLLFVTFVLLYGVFSILVGDPQVGSYSDCEPGTCRVESQGSLALIPLSVTILLLCSFGPLEVKAMRIENSVGVVRRIGAFYLDILLIMSITLPIVVFPGLLIEAAWTGNFEWGFGRNHLRSTDVFSWISVLAAFSVLYLYFTRLPKYGRPTIGQYICGFMIVPSTDEPMKLSDRLVAVWLAWTILPFTIVHVIRRKSKVYWWDNISQSRAVRTYYA